MSNREDLLRKTKDELRSILGGLPDASLPAASVRKDDLVNMILSSKFHNPSTTAASAASLGSTLSASTGMPATTATTTTGRRTPVPPPSAASVIGSPGRTGLRSASRASTPVVLSSETTRTDSWVRGQTPVPGASATAPASRSATPAVVTAAEPFPATTESENKTETKAEVEAVTTTTETETCSRSEEDQTTAAHVLARFLVICLLLAVVVILVTFYDPKTDNFASFVQKIRQAAFPVERKLEL
eukprot:ANDGO_00909.mRNA.1 hypothetical protein